VRARMHVLAVAGRVRRWHYAIAGRGAPNYYTLSRFGYHLVNDALTHFLPIFLDCPRAATALCFVDNRGRRAALIPKVRHPRPPRITKRPRGWPPPPISATLSGLPEAVACPV